MLVVRLRVVACFLRRNLRQKCRDHEALSYHREGADRQPIEWRVVEIFFHK